MFNTVKIAIARNGMIRNMSWGLKGNNYKIEQFNKNAPTGLVNSTKYGISYRVVNKSAVFSTSSNNTKPKRDTHNTHIFDVSFNQNIIISGADSKDFLDKIVTCDNKIMEVGRSRKSLMLNESGSIIGLGVVNRFQHYYSLIMESENNKKNVLTDHLYENVGNHDVIIAKNTLDYIFLVNGPNSIEIIKQIQRQLNPSTLPTCSVINNLAFHQNVKFTNQFVPNNTFSVINTPLGYYFTINKIIKNNLFSNLKLEISSDDIYHKKRIEFGIPDYNKDIGLDYNPIEANLHSYFTKSYKYSKRNPIGTNFIGKEGVFTGYGKFKRFKKTRVMMYSCKKGLIPPPNSNIFLEDKKVGKVSSSVFSDYLNCIVSMGYINLADTFNTRSFSLAREMARKVTINGTEYFIRFL